MGAFLNEFLANSQALPALIVFAVMALPTFSHFYNQWIDKLLDDSEHTSLYVVLGVLFVLVIGALFSWKAAILYSVLFALAGYFMVQGEYARTAKRKAANRTNKNQRKRLPYAANGLLDEARMSATEMHRLLGKALQASTNEEIYKHLASASHELTTITSKINEVKQIQEK
jgi:signal transduction histidine kinase